jgi:hypothetical protein
MRRPQFSLKTLLWLMVVVAAFFAGAAWSERRWARERELLLSSPFDHNIGLSR